MSEKEVLNLMYDEIDRISSVDCYCIQNPVASWWENDKGDVITDKTLMGAKDITPRESNDSK